MKKIFLVLAGFMLYLVSPAETHRTDSVAVMILNHMADVIGDLNSCSFKVTASIDVADHDLGIIKQSESDKVILVGPNKMLVDANGDKGHRGYWYNGSQLFYYSFAENNFARIDAPADILSTVAAVNSNYGIDFPAADFFYPTFTDDIIRQFDTVAYLGTKVVEGQECFHILVANKEQTVQFWISNDAYFLPKKFVITYKNLGNTQYEATFNDWSLNAEIPNSVFEFVPPPSAAEITLLPLTNQ